MLRNTLFSTLFLGLVTACGGSADLGGGPAAQAGDVNANGGAGASGAGASGAGASGATNPDAAGGTPGNPATSADSCEPLVAYETLVTSGQTISPRPTGSVLRFSFVYQGQRLAITGVRGVTMTIPPSSAPLQAGTNSGYWMELRTAADAVLDTRRIQDPTRREVPPGADGGFTNVLLPLCDEKPFWETAPNDPAARVVVVFGSPYGTTQPATELARFLLP